jgi:hypothetical protein
MKRLSLKKKINTVFSLPSGKGQLRCLWASRQGCEEKKNYVHEESYRQCKYIAVFSSYKHKNTKVSIDELYLWLPYHSKFLVERKQFEHPNQAVQIQFLYASKVIWDLHQGIIGNHKCANPFCALKKVPFPSVH